MKAALKTMKNAVAGPRKDADVAENVTLSVKSSPVKGAAQTSRLSILSDYIVKKNEQGAWNRRYACLVPHLFLYYFGE